jgi:tetratricopeptide (TPR) repeat protein
MLAQFSHIRDPSELRFEAHACVVIPDAVEDNGRAMRMAEVAATEVDAPPYHARRCLRTYAAWQYRLGRWAEAIETFSRAEKLDEEEGYCDEMSAFLAMAHHRLGHADEAREWSRRVHQSTNSPAARIFHWSIPAERLIAEMDQVLAGQTEAVTAPASADAASADEAKEQTSSVPVRDDVPPGTENVVDE